ncbi:DUF2142 domain-containing protein [Silanimonas algicola]
MNGFFRSALRALATLGVLLSSPAAVAAPHAVDELVLEASGSTLRGAGWFAPADPARPLAAIELVDAGVARRVAIETVRRPDVVVALGRPDLLESGWRFERAVEGPVPTGPMILRFLDPSGAVLATSAPMPIVRERAVPGAARHRLFVGSVALLLMGAVVVFWRRRRVRASAVPASAAADDRCRLAALSAGIVLAASLVLAAVVPPFQSPDEFDHVERAYALSKGRLLLDAETSPVSGLWVDDGLLAYMALHEHLPFDAGQRLADDARRAAVELGWRGTETFSGAAGTGYYLPVIYLPQAAALAIGRTLGVSVDASYRAARLASGLVASLLLFAAFLRWRPSMAAMALLLLPMTLFQWAGAGIDALSIGATALALALWREQEARGSEASLRRIAVVGGLLVVVVGCRFHMAPLLLVPLLMARRFTLRRVALGLVPLAMIAAWTLLALATTLHSKTAEMSAGDKLLAYANDPSRLFEVVWTTATTPLITDFWGRSFVGVLGWLDTALPHPVYAAWGVLLALAVAWSLAVADWRRARWTHAAGGLLAVGSALLVPLLLLLMWTPFESPTIDGVQGRYFLLPALALAMAIPAPREGDGGRFADGVGVGFTILVTLYTLVATLPVLVARYYG